MDASAPVLLFDSGVGGLSVLAQLQRVLPAAPVLYVADNGGLPYGTKTEAEVAARVCGLLGRLSERYHPRLICIACNTASTIALAMVRDVLNVPVVGTVPAIKPAAELTRSGVIGLLGTAATIRQPYVDRLAAEFAADKLLLRFAASELVGAAEAKLRGQAVNPAIYTRVAAGLRDQPRGDDIDTVVLACTHFPLVRDELRAVLGPDVRFIDGAAGIARRIVHLTRHQAFTRTAPDAALFTRDEPSLLALGPVLSDHGLGRVEILA
ncbi:MAG: glutamate racemase [Sphingomonadales bacterium]|nr:glutamate racemase [Sphingomonadales bacterium]